MATTAALERTAGAWIRFTPAQRTARFAVYLIVVAAIVAAVQTIEIIPEFLADAPEQIADLLTRMWPVDWAAYPKDVHGALVETIHIASLGTLLALVLALPIGVLAAHNLVRSTPVNLLAKLILVASRSVNSLVWALLFVGIFGPGALAGTLAIAFRSIGFVGKLFGEALEEAAFWSIALFRFDINVRESAVLGLVGAGGIGMGLDAALNLFQWGRVALILVAILAIVIIVEIAVTQIRKRVL
jgi:phosphonate transport system permease protein